MPSVLMWMSVDWDYMIVTKKPNVRIRMAHTIAIAEGVLSVMAEHPAFEHATSNV